MTIGETDVASAGLAAEETAARREAKGRPGCLFHPLVDFLCLGGGSLFVLVPLMMIELSKELQFGVVATGLMVANVVNHPHFAHSYQIFYRDFGRKLLGTDYAPLLRLRYLVAGVVVPLALILFFAVSIAQGDARMLGLGANLMVFLVGWHYVKQGYGMVIVDSVLKRRFFAQPEKKALVLNAYAVWILSWLLANWLNAEREFQGLKHYSFAIPDGVVYAAMAVAAVSTAISLYVLAAKCFRDGAKAPINGMVAYLVTLYVWLLFGFLNPIMLVLIPAFHSLQYLVVVWRYQLNVESNRPDSAEKPSLGLLARCIPSIAVLRFVVFLLFGLVLGYIGFWRAPDLATSLVPYYQAVFGATLYLFLFWIFINVHHYFLDNVMWRRENPETARYLFAHG